EATSFISPPAAAPLVVTAGLGPPEPVGVLVPPQPTVTANRPATGSRPNSIHSRESRIESISWVLNRECSVLTKKASGGEEPPPAGRRQSLLRRLDAELAEVGGAVGLDGDLRADLLDGLVADLLLHPVAPAAHLVPDDHVVFARRRLLDL